MKIPAAQQTLGHPTADGDATTHKSGGPEDAPRNLTRTTSWQAARG